LEWLFAESDDPLFEIRAAGGIEERHGGAGDLFAGGDGRTAFADGPDEFAKLKGVIGWLLVAGEDPFPVQIQVIAEAKVVPNSI
jgi:hypothetical protein